MEGAPKSSATPGTVSEAAAAAAARQRLVVQSLSVERLSSEGSGDNSAALLIARGTKRAQPTNSAECSDQEVLPKHPWCVRTLSSLLAALGNITLQSLAGQGVRRGAGSRGRGEDQGC